MADATYGGFWIRSLAFAADFSILTLALLALAVPFAFMGGAGMALYGLIAAIGPIAYFAWLTASERQRTFGKQLCGLKVQHAGSAERISLLRSIGRELAKFVSAAVLFIGFLLAGFTQRKQALHDMLASTVVVRDGPPRTVLAILVALAGVVIPVIVIPLMFAGMFAGLMAMMMGEMMGEIEVKSAKPAPTMEQKAAPRPQAPAAPSVPAAPAAVDDLATVYRSFHQAMLDSDVEGMRKWGTKAKGDELAAASAIERKMMLGLMASMTPKTYRVRSSEVSADGSKATLYLSAEQVDKGKTETVLATVTLLKEGGAWKVDLSSWGGSQPSGPAPQSDVAKPVAVEPAKPAAAEPPKPVAVELPKPVAAPTAAATPAPAAPAAQRRPAPSRSEAAAAKPAAPVLQQSKPPCVYKSVMTDEDMARCR
jgi:uncharacterized RDD family membrane protein YckC